MICAISVINQTQRQHFNRFIMSHFGILRRVVTRNVSTSLMDIILDSTSVHILVTTVQSSLHQSVKSRTFRMRTVRHRMSWIQDLSDVTTRHPSCDDDSDAHTFILSYILHPPSYAMILRDDSGDRCRIQCAGTSGS